MGVPGYASQRNTHEIPEPYPILTKQKKGASNDLFIMHGQNVFFLGGSSGRREQMNLCEHLLYIGEQAGWFCGRFCQSSEEFPCFELSITRSQSSNYGGETGTQKSEIRLLANNRGKLSVVSMRPQVHLLAQYLAGVGKQQGQASSPLRPCPSEIVWDESQIAIDLDLIGIHQPPGMNLPAVLFGARKGVHHP